MATYTSSHLYHFVGSAKPLDHAANFEILKKVLKERCISHPPHKVGWGTLTIQYNPAKRLVDGELIVPNVVCFCDIPSHALSIHVQKYGYFGLSIQRGYLASYGVRPVMYFPYNPRDRMSAYGITAIEDIESAVKGLKEQIDIDGWGGSYSRAMRTRPATMKEAVREIEKCVDLHMLAYTKHFDVTLSLNDPNNFYMEREWRRIGNVVFEAKHVEEVCVSAGFAKKLAVELPEYSGRIVELPVHP